MWPQLLHCHTMSPSREKTRPFSTLAEQLAIALLVLLLDLAHLLEQVGNVVKALLPGLLGHVGIHVSPLVVLPLGGGPQVFLGGADAAEQLEPDFRVLLLVGSRLLKQLGDLDIAVLSGLRGKVVILGAGLGLPSKSGAQVLLSLAPFQFRHLVFLLISTNKNYSYLWS